MRRLPFLVLLLLLPLPSSVPAAPTAGSAPEWRVGDSWQYKVTTQSGSLTTLGNLVLRVVSDGELRVGNSTVGAYTLSQKLKPWTPANASKKLAEEASWGPTYTIVTTTLIVEKRSLCTLVSNSTIRSFHGSDVTEDHELLVYHPSDGRLRFPLAVGASWNATFNLTRTRQYPFHVITDNSSVNCRYECQGFEKLPDGKEGFRVRGTADGAGTETVFWYSPRYRWEVRREEQDASAGTVRVSTLLKHTPGVAPSLFSSPQTLLAIGFGVAAVLMLSGALFATYRARHPGVPRDRTKKATEGMASGAPVPPRGGPPAAPPPAGAGKGRSL